MALSIVSLTRKSWRVIIYLAVDDSNSCRKKVCIGSPQPELLISWLSICRRLMHFGQLGHKTTFENSTNTWNKRSRIKLFTFPMNVLIMSDSITTWHWVGSTYSWVGVSRAILCHFVVLVLSPRWDSSGSRDHSILRRVWTDARLNPVRS